MGKSSLILFIDPSIKPKQHLATYYQYLQLITLVLTIYCNIGTIVFINKYKCNIMQTQIPIGELKTHCYQILEQIQRDNQKLVITKRGTPIAEVTSLQPNAPKKSLIGMLQSKAKINGDLLAPLNEQWEAENGN